MAAFPLVFDGHNDTILSLERTGRSFFDKSDQGHLDLPRAKAGGFGGGFYAVYIVDREMVEAMRQGEAAVGALRSRYGDENRFPEPVTLDWAQPEALRMLGKLLQLEPQSNGAVKVVRSAAELQSCLDHGTHAVLLHLEGAEPLDPDGYALETFHAAGVRSVGLTHSRRNLFGVGVPFRFPSSPDLGPGLTDAGKTLVKQLNRLKMVIDLSHLNEKGFWDVANLSDAPLVATHSNAWALTNHPRNLTDKQLDAVKASRGLVGLNFAVGFTRPDGARDPDMPISLYVDHIAYLVDRMGIDHVALGSDYDGTTLPNDMPDVTHLPKLMQALADRGFTGEALRKIAHGNWVRVLRATWGA